MGAPLALFVYGISDCAPCAVVKAALEDRAGLNFEVRIAGIDEIRSLRKQYGRKLVYPTIVLRSGDRELGRREGARSAEPADERRLIIDWIQGVRGNLRFRSEEGRA